MTSTESSRLLNVKNRSNTFDYVPLLIGDISVLSVRSSLLYELITRKQTNFEKPLKNINWRKRSPEQK